MSLSFHVLLSPSLRRSIFPPAVSALSMRVAIYIISLILAVHTLNMVDLLGPPFAHILGEDDGSAATALVAWCWDTSQNKCFESCQKAGEKEENVRPDPGCSFF